MEGKRILKNKNKGLSEVLISNKKGSLKTYFFAAWKASRFINSPLRFRGRFNGGEKFFSLVCYFYIKNKHSTKLEGQASKQRGSSCGMSRMLTEPILNESRSME